MTCLNLGLDRFTCRVIMIGFLSVTSMGAGSWANAQQPIDPQKVIGRNLCKHCHQSEFASWERSSHNQKAWALLDHPKAAEFGKAIGISNVKGANACTQCHGTHQKKKGRLILLKGNTCESCHGGAGGSDGWLKPHCDFGFGKRITNKITLAELIGDRAKETPKHRQARDAVCKTAGMNRSEDALDIAKNCLQCHLVSDENLVAAGHPISSRFEYVEWSQGEVRHNFLLNPKENAEAPTNWIDPLRNPPGRTASGRRRLMFVVGKLADLEVSLRIRAQVTSTKRGSVGKEVNGRILDLQDDLADFDIAALEPVLEAIKDVKKRSLKKVTSADRQIYTTVADAVAKAAKAFMKAHPNGNQLPKNLKLPSKVKGDVFQG